MFDSVIRTHFLRHVVWTGPLVVALLCPPPSSLQAQTHDWDRPNHNVRSAIRDYYGGPPVTGGVQHDCLADEGDRCFGGDVEDQNCTHVPTCRSSEDQTRFLTRLRAIGESHPDDAFATGQAVYAFLRLGDPIEAYRLAQACGAPSWWCGLLRGLVLDRSGQPRRAEAEYLAALQQADPRLACRLRDIEPLLAGADRNRYAAVPCGRRDSLEARFWWLADPFYSIEGNDRFTEHVSRRLEAVLHQQIVEAQAQHHPSGHEEQLVKWGAEDSWRGGPYRRFTSRRVARYHFAPESDSILSTIEDLRYDLDAGDKKEGFTPSYAPVVEVPAQFARFRQGDSLLIAVATELAPAPAEVWNTRSAVLVLSATPGDDLVVHPAAFEDAIVRFTAAVGRSPHVASVEVRSDTNGVGRNRGALMPLPTAQFVLSDLLLYESSGSPPPQTREDAVASMRGSTDVEAGTVLGLYWEAYGLSESDSISLSIEIENASRRGVLARVLGVLGIGRGSESSSTVSWSRAVGEGPYHGAVDLEASTLTPGAYLVRLILETGDGMKTEAVRAFRIVKVP